MGLIFDWVARHVPVRATLESLGQVFADYAKPDFRVRLWDGTSWSGSEDPRFTLVDKHPDGLHGGGRVPAQTKSPQPSSEPVAVKYCRKNSGPAYGIR
jgi:hypothetical protein